MQDLCGLLQHVVSSDETLRQFVSLNSLFAKALQGVSEDALTAHDNTFEMARYSREEMGPQHQDVAVQALTRMTGEIAQIQSVPQR